MKLGRGLQALFAKPRGGVAFAAAVGCGLAIAAVVLALLFVVAVTLHGCGYTETDMQLQRDRVARLQRTLDACEAAARACSARCSRTQK